MKQNKFNLLDYINQDYPVFLYKNETKIEIFKKYLNSKQQKYAKKADASKTTSHLSLFLSTVLGIGSGVVSNIIIPEMINHTTIATIIAASSAGLITSVVASHIKEKYSEKETEYKFLTECMDTLDHE